MGVSAQSHHVLLPLLYYTLQEPVKGFSTNHETNSLIYGDGFNRGEV
jgi:hypothetical protein